MLDKAFAALETYDWGADPAVLKPIDDALAVSCCDALARRRLEERLVDTLGKCVSRDAKDYVCRKLKRVGTAISVPALEALLPYPEFSHMARYALESLPHPHAGQLAGKVDRLKLRVQCRDR